MKQLFPVILMCVMLCSVQAQRYDEVNIFHITSSHTSFPDTARYKGHVYDSAFYSFEDHYRDSSVLIIVPKRLKANKQVDLIFWFHGWRNHIDSAAIRYELIKQFIASRCNAVLVLAETAKNAPDSYGGKLEQPGVFKELVNDVVRGLLKNKFIPKKCRVGNIMLAGHSGAYRVMAYILQNGGLPIKETVLFDALYSEEDKFLTWITQDTTHRFINWYTNTGGGTDEVSLGMMKMLSRHNIAFLPVEEKDLTEELFRSNHIVFIHSVREHNDIINNPDNFLLMLETSNNFRKLH